MRNDSVCLCPKDEFTDCSSELFAGVNLFFFFAQPGFAWIIFIGYESMRSRRIFKRGGGISATRYLRIELYVV